MQLSNTHHYPPACVSNRQKINIAKLDKMRNIANVLLDISIFALLEYVIWWGRPSLPLSPLPSFLKCSFGENYQWEKISFPSLKNNLKTYRGRNDEMIDFERDYWYWYIFAFKKKKNRVLLMTEFFLLLFPFPPGRAQTIPVTLFLAGVETR